jgi:hypothetical protein
VFKPALDEQRSTFFYNNFSNTELKLPVVGNKLPSSLNLIQKNSATRFAELLNFKAQGQNKSTTLKNLQSVNYNLTFSFPFNLSFESDSIRYTWFDWYSVRNSIIAKAMDTSVFNLHASRNYNYSYNNSTLNLELTNRYDNYFLKYSQARKFYLPTNLYKPFFFKLSSDFITNRSSSISDVNWTLDYYSAINGDLSRSILSNFKSKLTIDANSALRTASWSGNNSPLRPFFYSLNLNLNDIDVFTTLTDILFKRVYLVDSFLLGVRSNKGNRGFVTTVHNSNTNSLTQLTKKLKYKSNLTGLPGSSNLTKISQYQPLRKGIVNMIRIQADKAIAMPTDTRLQILAVSKDIIHS